MKKLLAVLMVLAFVAPAMADDTLDVSGEYRAEYYNISNSNYVDNDADDLDFWDQRFRLQLKIKPADGVMAVLRGDFTEADWGNYSKRPAPGNDVLMVDRAYAQVKKGMVTVDVGLRDFNLGDKFSYNNQGTGLMFTVKPTDMMSIRAAFIKNTEGTGRSDDETLGTGDTNGYLIDLGFKLPNKMGTLNVYYAMEQEPDTAIADEPNMFGAMFKGKIAMVNVKAFLDIFGGDNGAGTDYVGTQLYADVNAKLSKTLTVGADIVYSDGENSATEDKQVRFDDVTPDRQYLERGPMMGTVTVFRANGNDDLFNLDTTGGNSTGSMGIRPYVAFKVIPEVTLYANLGYFAADEDLDTIESVMTYSVGALWAMAPKTTVGLQYLAVDPDEDSDYAGTDYETWSGIGAIMKVKF